MGLPPDKPIVSRGVFVIAFLVFSPEADGHFVDVMGFKNTISKNTLAPQDTTQNLVTTWQLGAVIAVTAQPHEKVLYHTHH